MGLLSDWRAAAYSEETDTKKGQEFWNHYFQVEKEIYKQLLKEPEQIVTGTVAGLAEKYGTDTAIMTGFLDGINESLVSQNPIEEMTEDTEVSLNFDKEKLYYNMVGAGADWLYDLPEWEPLLTAARRKELFLTQRKSNTIVNEKKTGRNDKCPCDSGKKYKHCCGK